MASFVQECDCASHDIDRDSIRVDFRPTRLKCRKPVSKYHAIILRILLDLLNVSIVFSNKRTLAWYYLHHVDDIPKIVLPIYRACCIFMPNLKIGTVMNVT